MYLSNQRRSEDHARQSVGYGLRSRNKWRKDRIAAAYADLDDGDKEVIDDCAEQLWMNTKLGAAGALQCVAALGMFLVENPRIYAQLTGGDGEHKDDAQTETP